MRACFLRMSQTIRMPRAVRKARTPPAMAPAFNLPLRIPREAIASGGVRVVSKVAGIGIYLVKRASHDEELRYSPIRALAGSKFCPASSDTFILAHSGMVTLMGTSLGYPMDFICSGHSRAQET